MGNFQGGGNRGGGFRGNGGGRPSFPKKSWGDDRPKVMHQATCSECGQPCEVPFKPNGEKPVYCNNCFSKKRAEGDDQRPRRDFGDHGPRKSFGDRPSPRPSFSPAPFSDESKKQLTEINAKLDRLVSIMEKMYNVGKLAAVVLPAIKTPEAVKPKAIAEVKKAPVKAAAKAKPAVKAKKKK